MRQENDKNIILSKIAGYAPITKFASYTVLLVRLFPNISYYSYSSSCGIKYLREEMR